MEPRHAGFLQKSGFDAVHELLAPKYGLKVSSAKKMLDFSKIFLNLAVRIAEKSSFTLPTPVHDVMPGSEMFNPQWSRHPFYLPE